MSRKQTALSFLEGVAAGRLDAAVLADDAVFWTPTGGDADGARFAAGVGALAALFDGDFAYGVTAVVEEGERVMAEAISTGTFLDGEPYEQTHVFVFDFVDGRIARMAEHMNTLVTAREIVPRIQALMARR